MPKKKATSKRAVKKATHQPSPKVLACRANGRKGGLARAKNNTKAKMREWSSKGGRKCVDVLTSDFMSFLTTQRKTVGRYRKPVKQAA